MVHASTWDSAQIAKLSRDARLLYIGLITFGDDDGRLKASPALIRSQMYPYDDDVKVADVARWLKEIEGQKLVVGYEVEGEPYYFHPKWEEYQQIREDRRRESHIPAPDMEFLPVATKRQPIGNQKGDKAPPNISKDNISKDNINQDVAFVAFWEKYPYKVGKKAAWRAWQKVSYTPELGATIMAALEAWNATPQWTKDDGRYIPHPATWINGERWDDEIPAGKKKNTKYGDIGTTANA